MFSRILVPVDESSAALRAVDKAVGLAKAFGARVDLVHVIAVYPFAGSGTDSASGQNEYLAAAASGANRALARAEAATALAGVPSQRKIIEGRRVHEGILNAAEVFESDLIVMGSHGPQGMGKLLLGSTTQRVLASTDLPVLVVRGD